MDFKDSQRIYGVKFPQSTADDIVRYCPKISTFQITPNLTSPFNTKREPKTTLVFCFLFVVLHGCEQCISHCLN